MTASKLRTHAAASHCDAFVTDIQYATVGRRPLFTYRTKQIGEKGLGAAFCHPAQTPPSAVYCHRTVLHI